MERHEENNESIPRDLPAEGRNQIAEPMEPETAPRLPGKTRFPVAEHAKVTHYAYDPETYEVLCRPGQRLTEKKAQRLQELGLYAHVVSSTE